MRHWQKIYIMSRISIFSVENIYKSVSILDRTLNLKKIFITRKRLKHPSRTGNHKCPVNLRLFTATITPATAKANTRSMINIVARQSGVESYHGTIAFLKTGLLFNCIYL